MVEPEYSLLDGSNVVINRIGYSRYIQTNKIDIQLRSANEQYTIHEIAHMFESNTIKIPKPLYVVDNSSYIMEEFKHGTFVRPDTYYHTYALFIELKRFYAFMIQHGYWPYNFVIFRYDLSKFVMFDFSGFGTIQGIYVKFPKDRRMYTFKEAERKFAPKFYDYFSRNEAELG